MAFKFISFPLTALIPKPTYNCEHVRVSNTTSPPPPIVFYCSRKKEVIDKTSFNVAAFRRGASGTATSLATKAGTLFQKKFWERTDEDIKMLYPVVNQLKVIRSFNFVALYFQVALHTYTVGLPGLE